MDLFKQCQCITIYVNTKITEELEQRKEIIYLRKNRYTHSSKPHAR